MAKTPTSEEDVPFEENTPQTNNTAINRPKSGLSRRDGAAQGVNSDVNSGPTGADSQYD